MLVDNSQRDPLQCCSRTNAGRCTQAATTTHWWRYEDDRPISTAWLCDAHVDEERSFDEKQIRAHAGYRALYLPIIQPELDATGCPLPGSESNAAVEVFIECAMRAIRAACDPRFDSERRDRRRLLEAAFAAFDPAAEEERKFKRQQSRFTRGVEDVHSVMRGQRYDWAGVDEAMDFDAAADNEPMTTRKPTAEQRQLEE